MIINNQHRFVFIHIPKCAGSFVRRILTSYDSTGGFFGKQGERPLIKGRWPYAHIPLLALQQYFPAEFELIKKYNSYAVIRDPFERFPSSIAQRLKEHKGIPLHQISQIEIQNEIEEAVSYLSQHQQITDPTFIHFTRQSDYVELDGERLVNNLYSVGRVDDMLSDIGDLLGLELVSGDKTVAVNKTDVYRHDILRRIFESLRPIVGGTSSGLLPEWLKQRVRRVLYTSNKKNQYDIFRSDIVESFVREYYQQDFDLYKNVRSFE